MLLEQTGELNRRAQRLGYTPAPDPDCRARTGANPSSRGTARSTSASTRTARCGSSRERRSPSARSTRDRVLVAQNDSRNGFNHCGVDWTSDGGRSVGRHDPALLAVPAPRRPGRPTACVDPTVAWDSQGNSYVAGTLNDIGSNAPPNVVVVAKSDAGIGGAFFHSPNPHGGFMEYRSLPLGVPVNVNDPNIALDKPMIDADASPSSPKRDNLYLSWTRYGPEQESPTAPKASAPSARSSSASRPTPAKPGRSRSRSAAGTSTSARRSSATTTRARIWSWGGTGRSTQRSPTATRRRSPSSSSSSSATSPAGATSARTGRTR